MSRYHADVVDRVKCGFCERTVCEFEASVDASRLIRSTTVEHFTWCSARPVNFVGDVIRVYTDVLVEAHRRKRVLRQPPAA